MARRIVVAASVGTVAALRWLASPQRSNPVQLQPSDQPEEGPLTERTLPSQREHS